MEEVEFIVVLCIESLFMSSEEDLLVVAVCSLDVQTHTRVVERV